VSIDRAQQPSWCPCTNMLQHCSAVCTQVQTVLLAPIAPHWAEHVWGELLRRDGLVITAGWPQQPARGVDGALQLQR
jgi:leucyl-tRNA synthetase